MKVFSLYSDSCETRTALTDSFRLERGGQFVSGFQTDDVYSLQERIDLIGSLEFSPYNIDDDVNWLDDDERDDCD
jgi:hypothetical protein